MRVISGLAGGVRLSAPPGRDVRPTSDRVKESMFGSLGDIQGWTVVDLFAGAGSLGLEALSRGAGRVVFFDTNPRSLACVQKNVSAVQRAAPDLPGTVELIRASAESAPQRLGHLAGSVDLILADPPYHPAAHEYGAEKLVLDATLAAWATGALLVVEHATDTRLAWHPRGIWKQLRARTFGSRCLSFARQPQPA
jgi:16S rRNA (guanine966-N2)-methyltransferase